MSLKNECEKRVFWIVKFRYGPKAPWFIYRGNRGGLDPSIYFTKQEAEMVMKQRAAYMAPRCIKVVRLVEG